MYTRLCAGREGGGSTRGSHSLGVTEPGVLAGGGLTELVLTGGLGEGGGGEETLGGGEDTLGGGDDPLGGGEDLRGGGALTVDEGGGVPAGHLKVV
jgi:hypothetical protein